MSTEEKNKVLVRKRDRRRDVVGVLHSTTHCDRKSRNRAIAGLRAAS